MGLRISWATPAGDAAQGGHAFGGGGFGLGRFQSGAGLVEGGGEAVELGLAGGGRCAAGRWRRGGPRRLRRGGSVGPSFGPARKGRRRGRASARTARRGRIGAGSGPGAAATSVATQAARSGTGPESLQARMRVVRPLSVVSSRLVPVPERADVAAWLCAVAGGDRGGVSEDAAGEVAGAGEGEACHLVEIALQGGLAFRGDRAGPVGDIVRISVGDGVAGAGELGAGLLHQDVAGLAGELDQEQAHRQRGGERQDPDAEQAGAQ